MEIRLEARLDVPRAIDASISCGGDVEAALDSAIAIKTMDYPEYEGPTEFEPSRLTQVIGTASRTVLQDIVINPIPSNYGRIEYDGAALSVI